MSRPFSRPIRPARPEMWKQLGAIAQRHGCPDRVLFDGFHAAQHVAVRREAALYLRSLGYSYPQIGRWLGGKHHTTIMNLCKRQGHVKVQLVLPNAVIAPNPLF